MMYRTQPRLLSGITIHSALQNSTQSSLWIYNSEQFTLNSDFSLELQFIAIYRIQPILLSGITIRSGVDNSNHTSLWNYNSK
jgi:hypothetical protein